MKAPADGYTLLMIAPSNAVNVTLYDKLKFNFLRDIAPVGGIMRVPVVMEVNPSVPAKTVPEFIAYAKANPGKINMASGGNGSAAHVSGELFKMMTGIEMVHVPYRGLAPALTDLSAARCRSSSTTCRDRSAISGPAGCGRWRPPPRRARTLLPDVPTVGESVPGYEASAWTGVGAPRNTPAEIIERLNREINAGPRRSRRCRRGSPTSAARCCRARPPTIGG